MYYLKWKILYIENFLTELAWIYWHYSVPFDVKRNILRFVLLCFICLSFAGSLPSQSPSIFQASRRQLTLTCVQYYDMSFLYPCFAFVESLWYPLQHVYDQCFVLPSKHKVGTRVQSITRTPAAIESVYRIWRLGHNTSCKIIRLSTTIINEKQSMCSPRCALHWPLHTYACK